MPQMVPKILCTLNNPSEITLRFPCILSLLWSQEKRFEVKLLLIVKLVQGVLKLLVW